MDNIHLMVVSVGDQINNLELKGIASEPVDKNLFKVERFQDLPNLVQQLANAMCDGMCTFLLTEGW